MDGLVVSAVQKQLAMILMNHTGILLFKFSALGTDTDRFKNIALFVNQTTICNSAFLFTLIWSYSNLFSIIRSNGLDMTFRISYVALNEKQLASPGLDCSACCHPEYE